MCCFCISTVDSKVFAQVFSAYAGTLKEIRAQRAKEKAEKEAKRSHLLEKAKGEEMKTPGYQRLRAHEYDRLRKERANGRSGFGKHETIAGMDGLYANQD